MKIFIKDWAQMHPKKLNSRTDNYYTGLANKVYKVLFQMREDLKMEEKNDIKELALRITAWFEDIISELGIWQAVTSEYKKRYGSYLPFFNLDETYYPDEVNYEDIQFLLWHQLQQYHFGEYVILPDIFDYSDVVDTLFDLFNEEYGTAPENNELKAYLSNYPLDPDNIYPYRELLEWFHYSCYINKGYEKNAIEEVRELYSKLDAEENDSAQSHEFLHLLTYSMRLDHMFHHRSNLVSLTSPQLLALVLAQHKEHLLAHNVKSKLSQSYIITNEDNNFLYVNNIDDNNSGECYKITKDSFDENAVFEYTKEKTNAIFSMLVYYGNCWWQTGILKMYDHFESHLVINNTLQEVENSKRAQYLYEKFLAATGGKPIVFFKNKTAMRKFTEQNIDKKTDVSIRDKGKGIYLHGNPKKGLQAQSIFIEKLKTTENPFYNKEAIQPELHLMVTDTIFVDYKTCCYMIDEGMLEDAFLNTEGEERKLIFQENIQFMADYFHRSYRVIDA